MNPNTKSRGFTLVEMAIVVVVVAILLGGLLVPLNTQVELHRINDTQKTMEEIKEALIGFAMANGRLPCPDTNNDGTENFDSAVGACAGGQIYGLVPYVTLGVTGQDAWGGNFVYRVTSAFTKMVPATPFTLATDGDNYICSSNTCGTTGDVANNVVAVIVSRGKNQCVPPSCTTDENQNDGSNKKFISRPISGPGSTAGEFDDIVASLSPMVLRNRMVMAQKLP